MTALLANKVEF
jgi:hypothetical protein